MRASFTVTVALAAALLSGCATPNSTGGRYLQFREPISLQVRTQMTFPNPDTCLFALASIRSGGRDLLKSQLKGAASPADVDRLLEQSYFCTANDSSAALPYRATTRYVVANLVVDLYALNLEQCVHSLGEPTADSGVEIVSRCLRY
jgi:hypothetical protein